MFTGPAAHAQADALPAEVTQMRGTLHAELGKLAKEYNAALLPMAEDYVIDLRRVAVRMNEAKDAKGQEAVRKEATRFMKALEAEADPFETVPELTDDAVNKDVEALRLIQQGYIAKRTVADRLRNDKAAEFGERYADALERLDAKLADTDEAKAAAVKKEARRVRVVLQRKDAASVLFKEAKAEFRLMPPVPDVANLKERAEAPADTRAPAGQLFIGQLPPDVQVKITKPLQFDKDWPPEITKWKHEGHGDYSHDFSLYRAHGLPSELGIFVSPKTMRAYVSGTKRAQAVTIDGNVVTWMGKAMSWTLADSRDLVCKAVFTTKRPAVSKDTGPAGCVAVYTTTDNKLIASMSVPLIAEVTELRIIKQMSYNRLNISWVGAKTRRGFTIPDHTPLRVVIGVNCYHPGEETATLIEIDTCPQAGDMW
ncbi:MAG: hypothetical protein FWG50_05045 [Kiritimatiellaeota bacterium]|nr:hypothetical protein [Kiritimatiellota bacterium]